jgi:hydroxymethylglutaryl-CoA reductase
MENEVKQNKTTVPAGLFGGLAGFSKLTRKERISRLKDLGLLDQEDCQSLLSEKQLGIELAEHFIENSLGYFQLPLGVAVNFRIDGKDVVVPMAVEETSIIAAASKTAKWVLENGEITTKTVGKDIIGQIQIPIVKDSNRLQQYILENQNRLIKMANDISAHGLVARGGGVNRMSLRTLARPDGRQMAVIHVYMDACDAMGANIMNQVCELLKNPIQEETGEEVGMCILSNLVDSKLTRARVVMRGLPIDLISKIAEASLFAQLDPYRAATNNKGVMNGIDPILIATGNDWRAVEAGVHAYAAQEGQYKSITKWWVENGNLIGEFCAPLVVGIVGGVTKLHPTAKIALKLLKVNSGYELAQIAAAVGLVQNLGALRALTTVGIIEGHMKLHIRNLLLGAGATTKEEPLLQRKLEELLALTKRVTLGNAVTLLQELREAMPSLREPKDASPVAPTKEVEL